MTWVVLRIISIGVFIHQNINEVLSKLFDKYHREILRNKSGEKYFSKNILNNLNRQFLSIKSTLFLKKVGYQIPPSFEFLIKHSRRILTEKDLLQWKINNKLCGASFARNFGFDVPKIYQKKVLLDKVAFKNKMVLKPISGAGSRGVYIILDNNNIWSVKSQSKLNGFDELISEMKQLIDSGIVKNSWLVEECVTNSLGKIAHDLKFYTFYGKVYMVHEVKRLPKSQHCFWNRSHKIIETGRYDPKLLFHGDGYTQLFLEKIEALSLQIPCAFLRIDCFNAGNRLVFGEFTPSPGSYSKFNKETDRLLGLEYLEAEHRLFNDLLDGKSFVSTKNILGENGKK